MVLKFDSFDKATGQLFSEVLIQRLGFPIPLQVAQSAQLDGKLALLHLLLLSGCGADPT